MLTTISYILINYRCSRDERRDNPRRRSSGAACPVVGCGCRKGKWRSRPRARAAARSEISPVLRAAQQGEPAVHRELGVDVAEVSLDGLLADRQPGGDLPVAQPAADQADDLQLPRSENASGFPRSALPPHQLVERT